MADLATTPALETALADARSAFADALARDDAHAAAQVYADDARLILPAAEMLDGRSAIEAFWRAGLDAGMRAFELDPVQLVQDPAFACEVGRYTLRSDLPQEHALVERGAYLIVHRRNGAGAWRRSVELLSPDQAAGPGSGVASHAVDGAAHPRPLDPR